MGSPLSVTQSDTPQDDSEAKMAVGQLLRERKTEWKYDIIFSKKPLGITITAGRQNIDCYITEINKSCSLENAHEWITLNSKLIKINGNVVEGCDTTIVAEQLRSGKMPMRLTLKHPKGLSDDEVPDFDTGRIAKLPQRPKLLEAKSVSASRPQRPKLLEARSVSASRPLLYRPTSLKLKGVQSLSLSARLSSTSSILIKRDKKWNYDVIIPTRPLHITLTSSKEKTDGYVTAINEMCPVKNAEEKLTLNSKLIYVNGNCVEGFEMAVIAKLLESAKLPLRLTLVHPRGLGKTEVPDLEPGSEEELGGIMMPTGPLLRKRDGDYKYDIIFSKKPLGITLTPSKNSIDAYITSIEKSCPVENAAERITLNSKVIYVNGNLVESCNVTNIIAHLRSGTLPLRLTLIPPRGLRDDELPDLETEAFTQSQLVPTLQLENNSSKLHRAVSYNCKRTRSYSPSGSSSTFWDNSGPKRASRLIKRDRQYNYDVIFPTKPLHITLTSSKENTDGYVTAISKMCPLEDAEEKLTLNSKVIYVNGNCVEGCEVTVIAKHMKDAILPLRLTLVHPNGLGDNEIPDMEPGPTMMMQEIP